MSTYAFFDPATQAFSAERAAPYTLDGEPAAPPEGLLELQITRPPAPETAPHQVAVLAEPVIDLEARTAVFGWTVRDRTPAEIPPITKRQLRLWLHRQGLLANVEQIVAAAGAEAQIEWDAAGVIEREWPLTIAVVGALGMDAEEGNLAFVEAAAL
jgi:hypothetical protein